MVVGSIISIIFTYYCDENKRKEIRWKFQSCREIESTHEFEFLHELIGAKTEDILHDKDTNSLN